MTDTERAALENTLIKLFNWFLAFNSIVIAGVLAWTIKYDYLKYLAGYLLILYIVCYYVNFRKSWTIYKKEAEQALMTSPETETPFQSGYIAGVLAERERNTEVIKGWEDSLPHKALIRERNVARAKIEAIRKEVEEEKSNWNWKIDRHSDAPGYCKAYENTLAIIDKHTKP